MKGALYMYEARELAKSIVSKCIADNCPISNLQLQKILYYIQREFLQSNRGPAFNNVIEAWQFGPVVPDVYYYFCGSGAMPIFMFRGTCDRSAWEDSTVRSIVESKRVLYPWDLVAETHKPGGAWDQIYQDGKGNHQTIPMNLIRTAG